MVWGDTKVLSSTGTGLPLGEFVSILDTRVEDKDRAAPYVQG